MACLVDPAGHWSDRLTSVGVTPSVAPLFTEAHMTDDDRIKLEPSWKAALRAEFEQPYMQQLREFLRGEYAAGKQIYPPGPLIFNALNSTPDRKSVV